MITKMNVKLDNKKREKKKVWERKKKTNNSYKLYSIDFYPFLWADKSLPIKWLIINHLFNCLSPPLDHLFFLSLEE